MEVLSNDLNLEGKIVFVRVDFNVPIDDKGQITSKKRIDSTIPQINFLRDNGARIVICSHLGRPAGERNSSLSLKPVYEYLKEIYGNENVIFSKNIIGEDVEKIKRDLKNSQILLLENVRFEKGEEDCDISFAKELAKQVDIFVDEAFAVSHRKAASNHLMPTLVQSFYGFNHSKEQANLTLKDKPKPILAILGGAKVSDKIKLISSLICKVDEIFVGGAMAFTFLKSQGFEIGKSLLEENSIDLAKDILKKAEELNVKIHFPLDVVLAPSIEDENNVQVKNINAIPNDLMGLDIGPKTIQFMKRLIEKSNTIFWNGPLGVASVKAFENGTVELVKALANSNAFSIVGGGDSVEVVERLKLEDKISFVSTGGGASLKYIQKD